MDNEPSGWGNTHRDIHPGPPGWDELLHDTIPYARMIKAVDPTAQIDGPGGFGVPAYTGMGKPGDDSAAHGGVEQAAYYLAQMRAAQAADPTRTAADFLAHVEQAAATDPDAARWHFVADNLNIHMSTVLVRYVAAVSDCTEDPGLPGKRGILRTRHTRASFL